MDRESSLLYEIIRLVVPKSFRPEVGSIESREIARGEGGHRGPCSHAHHTKRVSISVCMRLSSYTILRLHRCIRGYLPLPCFHLLSLYRNHCHADASCFVLLLIMVSGLVVRFVTFQQLPSLYTEGTSRYFLV